MLDEIARRPASFGPVPAIGPVALYGAGKLGLLARDFLQAVGQTVVMGIDRDAPMRAREAAWSGMPLARPGDVPEPIRKNTRLAITVATSPYVPIERDLVEKGFGEIVPFYDLAESFRHLHPLSNGWFAATLETQDQSNTADVLRRWDDDVSRAHHLQFLAWRRLREEWTFDPAPPVRAARFFISEVEALLREDEIFLDAGAHHGSVIKTLIDRTHGAFRQIVAIEPDAANRALLENNLRAWCRGDPRISVKDCVLAASESDALFHEGLGYASQLSVTGRTRVTTRTIDTLGIAPTFLKLHLEGGELAALQGAVRTILSCRPIVAATVYHNADGIWRMPLWLMSTLPDYRFLFRVDSWCGTGAVVYCLPNERLT